MFGSTILEIVLGLAFIYLLLSLVCMTVAELIFAALRMRAKDLRSGIRVLLRDRLLVEKFYDHPMIRSLTTDGDFPPYIPSRSFALTLLDIVSEAAGSRDRPAGIRQAVAALPEDTAGGLRRVLLNLSAEAGGDALRLRDGVEAWFNDAMDRVSGAYRMRAQQVVLLVALALTVAANADTLGVARSIWNGQFLRDTMTDQAHNMALRDSVVERASQFSAAGSNQADASANTAGGYASPRYPDANTNSRAAYANSNYANGNTNANANVAPSPRPSATPLFYTNPVDMAMQARRNATLADGTGFPLGWTSAPLAEDPRGVPERATGWVLKIIGWLLTALVVSLGASFWFDVLNKFAVVRSTVKPRERAAAANTRDEGVKVDESSDDVKSCSAGSKQ
jgi:hypothetical protein